MNGFLTNDFNRTGRAGKMIDVGKCGELGASRTINLEHNNRDRNQDNKGNSNINRGLRFSNISNRDNSNKDNPRFRNQDNNLRRKFSSKRDNLRRKFSSRKDKSKDLMLSNHNTLGLKENLKEGR